MDPPRTRLGAYAIAFAVIALCASIFIQLTGPRKHAHSATLSVTPLPDALLRIDDISVTGNPHCAIQLREPRVKRVEFEGRARLQSKGSCLPSGIRQDFCSGYGKLDTDTSLFNSIADCRGVESRTFVGGCRVSNTQVIDYCITTADIDWSLCRQKQTACELLQVSGRSGAVFMQNSSRPIYTVSTNFTISPNTTNLQIQLLVSVGSSDSFHTNLVASVYALNNAHRLRDSPATVVDTSFAGEAPAQLQLAVNGSAVGTRITSIGIYLLGAVPSTIVNVVEILTSSCSFGPPAVPVVLSLCEANEPVLLGSAHADLTKTAAAGSGFYHAPIAVENTTDMSLFPYTLLIFHATPIPSTWSKGHDMWHSISASATDIDWRGLHLMAPGKMYDLVLNSSTGTLLVPSSMLQDLTLASESSLTAVVTAYGVKFLTCVLGNLTASLHINSTTPGPIRFFNMTTVTRFSVPIQQEHAIDCEEYMTNNKSNIDGYATFQCRTDIDLYVGPVINGSTRAFCTPIYTFTGSRINTTHAIIMVVSTNQSGWDLQSATILNASTTRLSILSALPFYWPLFSTLHANITAGKVSVVIDKLVCSIDSSSTTAAQFARDIHVASYGDNAATVLFRGLQPRPKAQYATVSTNVFTYLSYPAGYVQNFGIGRITTFDMTELCLPAHVTTTCPSNASELCIVPYKCANDSSAYKAAIILEHAPAAYSYTLPSQFIGFSRASRLTEVPRKYDTYPEREYRRFLFGTRFTPVRKANTLKNFGVNAAYGGVLSQPSTVYGTPDPLPTSFIVFTNISSMPPGEPLPAGEVDLVGYVLAPSSGVNGGTVYDSAAASAWTTFIHPDVEHYYTAPTGYSTKTVLRGYQMILSDGLPPPDAVTQAEQMCVGINEEKMHSHFTACDCITIQDEDNRAGCFLIAG